MGRTRRGGKGNLSEQKKREKRLRKKSIAQGWKGEDTKILQ